MHVSFLFSIFYLSCQFNFSFDAQNFLLFMNVAILSFCQSPVNCRSGNAGGNLTHKLNCCNYCHFPSLDFMQLPGRIEGLPSQGRGDGGFLKIVYFFWIIMLEAMPGNVISEVDALMCVVLSRSEKHVQNGELVGTLECIILKLRCHTNRGHYS